MTPGQRRARVGTAVTFALADALNAVWAVRIPALTEKLDLDAGDIGTSADAHDWVAARMRITPATLAAMLDGVRLITPSESDALLGPPRPRLMTTAARIQAVLLESGLVTRSQPLEPIFSWPVGVNQSACRG